MCSTVLNDLLGVLFFILSLALLLAPPKQSSHLIKCIVCKRVFVFIDTTHYYKGKSWLADGDSTKKMPTKCLLVLYV